jgi:hypothetical protein
MDKKGYFFIIDSLVAMLILGVGLTLLLSAHEYRPPIEQPFTVSDDVINVLSYNKIEDINNNYAGPNSVLTRNGSITDISKSLIEQMAEFYYLNNSAQIDKFLKNITLNLIPEEYSYIIRINGTLVYNHSVREIESSRFVIPARTIVHGMHDKTTLYGPYTVEVLSWG